VEAAAESEPDVENARDALVDGGTTAADPLKLVDPLDANDGDPLIDVDPDREIETEVDPVTVTDGEFDGLIQYLNTLLF